jgi:hypothetical protein
VVGNLNNRCANAWPLGKLLTLVFKSMGSIMTSKAVQREDGDVAVWSSVPDHDHGHVQVYFDGTWYSDFRQEKLSPWQHLQGSSVSIYRYQGQQRLRVCVHLYGCAVCIPTVLFPTEHCTYILLAIILTYQAYSREYYV